MNKVIVCIASAGCIVHWHWPPVLISTLYIASFTDLISHTGDPNPSFQLSSSATNSYDLIKNIIHNGFKDKSSRVVFFDVDNFTKGDAVYALQMLSLASSAKLYHDWIVVLSMSGGTGWMINYDTDTNKWLRQFMGQLNEDLVDIKSQNFTDSEACEFIEENKIDVSLLDKHGIEPNNNPRILRVFKNTATKSKHDFALQAYESLMRKLVQDLFSILEKKEFDWNLSQCLTFVEHARHGVPVSKQHARDYRVSYLNAENLTYSTDVSSETFLIRFHIPDVYQYIVIHLKHKYYDSSETHIRANPIVKGYIFKHTFLTSTKLAEMPLHVSAINVDGDACEFSFPALLPSDAQLTSPLKTTLADRCIYYLRPKHPAIDSVVFIDGDRNSVDVNAGPISANSKFLLFLQLSISDYRAHHSKGKDILKSIQKLEGKSGSIAEYYQSLCGVTDQETVIYVIFVYVSPKENNPSSSILKFEVAASGSPSTYYYGFLRVESPAAHLVKEIMDLI